MDSTQQMLSDLAGKVSAHIAREDARDEQRDADWIKLQQTLDRLSEEHVELMREWREVQAIRQRRKELFDKVRSSVAGWIVVAVLGWIVATGAAVATKAGIAFPWSAK